MNKTPEDVFQKMVDEATAHISDGTVNEDLWYSTAVPLLGGLEAGDAGRVVERLRDVGNMIMDVLDYPPVAVLTSNIQEALAMKGVDDIEAGAAINGLVFAKRISEINGWWVKNREQISFDDLSTDDLAWLTGGGRHAQ